jgi:hypothetical protein
MFSLVVGLFLAHTLLGCQYCYFLLVVCLFATERDFNGSYYTWKVFSCMSLLKGLWLVVTPMAAIRKFLGMSEVGKKPQALSKALGHEVVASAILMGSLAMGIKPV